MKLLKKLNIKKGYWASGVNPANQFSLIPSINFLKPLPPIWSHFNGGVASRQFRWIDGFYAHP